MAERTDEDLARAARAGDREAYGHLVTRYQGHVYGLAWSIAGEWPDAQDIAQETFVRAWCHLDGLREPGRFPAWLRRVAFSVTMSWLKVHRPRLFRRLDGRVDLAGLDVPDFRPGPSETLMRRELADAVLRAVADLPSRYRIPLTMFHLDGLSFKKVAEFLDIPIGTARSLVFRARKKLKAVLAATLAEEVEPMVKDVFDEHRLPPDFSRRVLENVPRVGYTPRDGVVECTPFPSSLRACLTWLGEDVPYARLMGVSGAAFRLIWKPGWHLDNVEVRMLAEDPLEPLQRTFEAVGYSMTADLSPGRGDPTEVRRRVLEAIGRDGRPVLGFGVVGPPECCVVTGFDEAGEVLIGWSFFQDDREFAEGVEFEDSGYFRKRDWLGSTEWLVFFGEKEEPPPDSVTDRRALEWALTVMRRPEVRGRASGLAAYEAWAKAMLDDEGIGRDPARLAEQKMVVGDAVNMVMEGRWTAADFVREIAGRTPAMADALEAAAVHFTAEMDLMRDALEPLDGWGQSPAQLELLADPDVRRRVAPLILDARGRDAAAADEIERALAS
ncbi:MAG: RNA polymerase sigma factor [Planctomycetota bacterium]|jgi:RNA polymerase sigma factor (sigma-70 family)